MKKPLRLVCGALAALFSAAMLAGCSVEDSSIAVSYTHLDVYKRQLPPLISIAECEYYKRDFKPGSSFLRGTFLSLFQSKIVLILFCWK